MYKEFLCYPAVFEQENQTINVFFPDFVGCISGGDTIEQATRNAKEALSLHLYGMEEDKEQLPLATSPKCIELKENQFVIMIDINYQLYKDKMDKKCVDRMVTLPRYLNAIAKESGINISQVLQEALRKQLGL